MFLPLFYLPFLRKGKEIRKQRRNEIKNEERKDK
jgi:hypothetical protein